MAAFFGANEIWSTYEGDGREPVILVGVRELDAKEPVSEEEFQHSLSELAELAKACDMNPVDTVTQTLAHINTGLYVGAGKADEIRIGAEMFGAERVIFNDTLSPSQIRNLQKLLKLPVMDRTALILEIFERRYDQWPTIFCTQYKTGEWHPRLGGGVVADAIMDRIVHNSTTINAGKTNMREFLAAHPL